MGSKLTQAEGFILGVGAKMFTIADSVTCIVCQQVLIYLLMQRSVKEKDVIGCVFWWLLPLNLCVYSARICNGKMI